MAPVQKYRWQHANPPYQFLRQTNWERFSRQFVDVVTCSLRSQSGLHTAIVSNEYFHEVHEGLIPLLRQVEDAGVEVLVVAYVRKHPAFAQSAHAQWALKHKAAPGHVVPFKANPDHWSRRFSDKLAPFDEAFGPRFMLRNFDAVDDVVTDFLEATELKHVDVRRISENTRPSPEEELLRAFYNDRQPGRVLPEAFEHFADPTHVDFDLDLLAWFAELLPSQSDLDAISERMRKDREQLNALLSARDQPVLSDDSAEAVDGDIDRDRLLSVIVQLLYSHHLLLAERREPVAGQLRRLARRTRNALRNLLRRP